MLDLDASHKNYDQHFPQSDARSDRTADVLVFPFQGLNMAEQAISAPLYDNTIDRRMSAPLCSNEIRAVSDMIKYRARHLGQELWVATATFLAAMGVDEVEDLCRYDFVRAVEYLVDLKINSIMN